MIHVFATATGARDTFESYLTDWAGDLASRFHLHLYEDLVRWSGFTPGLYLFTDHERLTDRQLGIVRGAARQLAAQVPGARIANAPDRVPRRKELLDRLADSGINGYRAYPALKVPESARFPLFLRNGRDHKGPRSKLLETRSDLHRAIFDQLMHGIPEGDLLAIEYCHTQGPDGQFRKYSVFRVGEAYLPAHVIYAPEWVAKDGDPPTPELVAEEHAWVRECPQLPEVRRIFEAVGIEFGRIDFGIREGRIEVWEINTCPVLLYPRKYYEEKARASLPLKLALAARFLEAFAALEGDPGDPAGLTVPVRLALAL